MRKKQLLEMKELVPTSDMLQVAQNDKRICKGKYFYEPAVYYYGKMLMAYEAAGKLKISVFSTEHIKFGANLPFYNIYLDKAKVDYIVYDFLHERWSQSKLDNLDWPGYAKGIRAYIEEESQKCILQYLQLEDNCDPYEAILSFQDDLHEKRLYERDSKKMETWQKKMLQVPDVPKDWSRWIKKVGITQSFIFYEYRKGGSNQGYCTWCENTVPIRGAKHNAEGRCGCCGRKIQYKSIGRMAYTFETEDTAYLLQRSKDNEVVVREFYICRHYFKKDYKKTVIKCKERRRIFYDKEMEPTEYYFGNYKKRIEGWIEGPLKVVTAGVGYAEVPPYDRAKVYGRTIPSLSKTLLKRTGFAEMWKVLEYISPPEYFYCLEGFPFLEQLAKAGLFQLAIELINGGKNSGKIQIVEGKELGKRLGIDRFRVRRLYENNGGLLYLKWLQHEKATNKLISDSVIKWFEQKQIDPETIHFILDRMSELQVKNYLVRQCKETEYSVKNVIFTWYDYLKMAKRVQMDVSDPIVYRVKSLVKRHDELIRLVKDKEMLLRAGEIAEQYPDIDRICVSIRDKYQFEDSDYQVIVPTIEEILNDAKYLHHCVDTTDVYFERINTRETYILLLRKNSEADKPFYTLEVEPDGTIRQARTKFNRQEEDFELIKPFLYKWQKQLKQKLKKEDYELTAKSRIEMKAELNRLRKEKVKINGGGYQGRLLADVLEEDLMEAA